MACKGARRKQARAEILMAEQAKAKMNETAQQTQPIAKQVTVQEVVEGLLFGVDSKFKTDTLLQNNLTLFEWAARNKIYPNFWGRNLVGENALSREEIDFIHSKGCKIAAIYTDNSAKETEEDGRILAKKIDLCAFELGVPEETAIFLEIGETEVATRNFMLGFISGMIDEGYIPGFKANTDAAFDFDREYSRGMQTDRELFSKCLIWAVAPSLPEYDRVTTTHLIHPDNWKPFAPSGITRKDIAVWQYGKNCHPIADDADIETTFNINLVRDDKVIVEKMF